MQSTCNVAVKGCEASLMLANLLCIDPAKSAVVSRADVDKSTGIRPSCMLKVLLVPDGSFVIKKFGSLCVPVTWDAERGRVSEVVVLGMSVRVEGGIHEEAVLAKLLMQRIDSCRVLIDNRVPLPIQ